MFAMVVPTKSVGQIRQHKTPGCFKVRLQIELAYCCMLCLIIPTEKLVDKCKPLVNGHTVFQRFYFPFAYCIGQSGGGRLAQFVINRGMLYTVFIVYGTACTGFCWRRNRFYRLLR